MRGSFRGDAGRRCVTSSSSSFHRNHSNQPSARRGLFGGGSGHHHGIREGFSNDVSGVYGTDQQPTENRFIRGEARGGYRGGNYATGTRGGYGSEYRPRASGARNRLSFSTTSGDFHGNDNYTETFPSPPEPTNQEKQTTAQFAKQMEQMQKEDGGCYTSDDDDDDVVAALQAKKLEIDDDWPILYEYSGCIDDKEGDKNSYTGFGFGFSQPVAPLSNTNPVSPVPEAVDSAKPSNVLPLNPNSSIGSQSRFGQPVVPLSKPLPPIQIASTEQKVGSSGDKENPAKKDSEVSKVVQENAAQKMTSAKPKIVNSCVEVKYSGGSSGIPTVVQENVTQHKNEGPADPTVKQQSLPSVPDLPKNLPGENVTKISREYSDDGWNSPPPPIHQKGAGGSGKSGGRASFEPKKLEFYGAANCFSGRGYLHPHVALPSIQKPVSPVPVSTSKPAAVISSNPGIGSKASSQPLALPRSSKPVPLRPFVARPAVMAPLIFTNSSLKSTGGSCSPSSAALSSTPAREIRSIQVSALPAGKQKSSAVSSKTQNLPKSSDVNASKTGSRFVSSPRPLLTAPAKPVSTSSAGLLNASASPSPLPCTDFFHDNSPDLTSAFCGLMENKEMQRVLRCKDPQLYDLVMRFLVDRTILCLN